MTETDRYIKRPPLYFTVLEGGNGGSLSRIVASGFPRCLIKRERADSMCIFFVFYALFVVSMYS